MNTEWSRRLVKFTKLTHTYKNGHQTSGTTQCIAYLELVFFGLDFGLGLGLDLTGLGLTRGLGSTGLVAWEVVVPIY